MNPEMTRAVPDMLDALARAPAIIIPMVREVPAEALKRRPRPGKWSAHEHACHLAAVHPMFFARLALMREQDHPAIRGYQPDREQEPDALLAVDLDDALRRFAHDRAELVTRLRGLRRDEWARTAEHEEYSHYSIFILFRHAVMHDMLHAYRIEECLLQKAWPDDAGLER
jgi:uncharacterized damage-inducible protein DinB